MIMHFSDGVVIDTSGKLRLERQRGELYVTGQGFLCPVNSIEEGHDLIKVLKQSHPDG